MVPEAGSCDHFIVTSFVEVFAEKTIWRFPSLWQAVASLDNLEIDSSIAGVASEVIFVNELLRDVQDLDANILRMLHKHF